MLLRFALIAALALPVFARDDDYRWSRDRRDRDEYRYNRGRDNDRYRERRTNDRYGYGNNRGYGYGTNNGYGYGSNSGYGYGTQNSRGIINSTLSHLQSAASRNRVDGHERDHFNRAMSELRNMQYNGGSDSGRLDRVMEDLDHLSRADQIHPRDRQILASDRQALASMAGGYGYNPW